MLKQAFRQGKKLQKEIKPLFNIFSNRLDNLVNSYDEENIISHCQNRNATSPQLPAIEKNRVAGHSKIEEGATERNRVTGCFEIKEEIESVNEDTFDVSFLY